MRGAVASILLLVCAAAPRPALAQLPPSAASFDADATSTAVPFEIVHDLMVIPVSVNGGAPLRMILDTGAPVMLIPDPEVAERVGVRLMGQANVNGGGDGPVQTVPIGSIDSARVGAVSISGMLAITGIARDVIPGVDGVIGGPLFANTVVSIDWTRQLVTFTRPDAFQHGRDAVVMPLEVAPSLHAYVTGVVTVAGQPPTPLRLHLDTGARQPLAIFAAAPGAPAAPGARIRDTIVTWGSRGAGRGDIAATDRVTLGRLAFDDVLTAYPRQHNVDGTEHGRLGLDLLRTYRATIDYPHGRLIFEGPRLPVARPAFTTLGIVVPPSRDHDGAVPIADIIEGSPAAGAGIREGDVLMAVAGADVSSLTASELRARLAPAPGSAIVVTVSRGGARRDVRLVATPLVGRSSGVQAGVIARDGRAVARYQDGEREGADARQRRPPS